MAFFGKWRRQMGPALGAILAMGLAACGGAPAPIIDPLQSQLPTPTRAPTTAPPPSPAPATPTRTGAQALAATLTPKAGPTIILTPGFQGTSQAVILTITAQYFSPTPPATPTRKPGSVSVGAGGSGALATSTPVSGLVVATFSEKVPAGGAASLEIRSVPGALCTISQKQNGLWQNAPGLAARVTTSDGSAAWVWNLDPATPPGPLELFVDCGAGRNATVQILVEK